MLQRPNHNVQLAMINHDNQVSITRLQSKRQFFAIYLLILLSPSLRFDH